MSYLVRSMAAVAKIPTALIGARTIAYSDADICGSAGGAPSIYSSTIWHLLWPRNAECRTFQICTSTVTSSEGTSGIPCARYAGGWHSSGKIGDSQIDDLLSRISNASLCQEMMRTRRSIRWGVRSLNRSYLLLRRTRE